MHVSDCSAPRTAAFAPGKSNGGWGVTAQGKFSPVFQRLIDGPDASLEALRADAAEYERSVLAEEDGRHLAQATIPYRGILGFMLFDARGEAVPLDQQDWVPRFPTLEALMLDAEVRSSDGRLLCLSGSGARTIFVLWAPYAETGSWNLPARIREAASDHANSRIVLVVGSAAEPIEAAASAFGLNHLQRRVVAAVVRTGNLRTAAAQLAISYHTARESMVAATKRMSLRNTPAVVRAVVAAAFGILPGDFDRASLLSDMLRITERQAQVALLISSGSSREATAQAVGTSLSVIKKDLELLYGNFGVQSAAELARVIVEVQALRLFARSIDGAPGFIDTAIEPSRLAVRPNTFETIGWSDYGPASAKPVLIVHSNWSCRPVPRPLLVELQRRGWRPIAIDRAGLGVTHLGRSTPKDPFGQSIADTLQVLNLCRIERIPVIAKCGAQFVHALKSAASDRIGAVVLVSPTPRTQHEGKRVGLVGAVKEAFFRRPRLIEFFFRIIFAQVTLPRVEQMTRAIAKGSSADEALCDDPQFIRDRFRALRPMSSGNFLGGVHEEYVVSHGGWPFEPLDVTDWVVLHGAQDDNHSLEEVVSDWGTVLPRASIVDVAEAGRFMTSSHPALVVDHLMRLA